MTRMMAKLAMIYLRQTAYRASTLLLMSKQCGGSLFLNLNTNMI